ncbi:MAG: hypothetical protein QNJ98_03185 [Planctomycetota bacterium]|nr:hypothetical protein [Planctomycetota bacterium]
MYGIAARDLNPKAHSATIVAMRSTSRVRPSFRAALLPRRSYRARITEDVA